MATGGTPATDVVIIPLSLATLSSGPSQESNTMPVVRAQFWSGATAESKNAIAASITEVMVKHLSCPPTAVTVLLEEIDKEDWFIGGVDSVTLSEGH
jgi:4-oxalocrotonate tautomerase